MHLAAQHVSEMATGYCSWLAAGRHEAALAGWFSHFWLATYLPVPTLVGWLAARLELALRLLLAVPTCPVYLCL